MKPLEAREIHAQLRDPSSFLSQAIEDRINAVLRTVIGTREPNRLCELAAQARELETFRDHLRRLASEYASNE